MGIKTNISKLHYDKQAKGFLFNLLKFCSVFYGVGSRLKNEMYDRKILKPKKVNAFVISVGNVTTGGVGKTPVVAKLAEYLEKKGERVAIISRGYGGTLKGVNVISDGEEIFFSSQKAGDEPHWLAENTHAIVITSPVRYLGAKLAIKEFGATKIILDDGFQHRKLHRDLDILLVDSDKAFGNENLLPAGPLREGMEAFGRVDKLVVVSKNFEHTRAEKYAKIMGKRLKKDTVVCYTEPDFIYNIRTKEHLTTKEKVVAFSAIGQPKQFYGFLKDFEVVKTVDFDDHHTYSQKDLNELEQICKKFAVTKLITTEKDAVKLAKFDYDMDIFALKLKTNIDVEHLLN